MLANAQTNGCNSVLTAACAINEVRANSKGTTRNFNPQETLDALSDSDIFEQSGVQGFDPAIKRVLTRLAEIYRVFPDFKYINDDAAANAYASDSSTLPDRRGTIYFGKNMLTDQLGQNQYGDMVVLAICAHEFSHIKQFEASAGFEHALRDKPCYAVELHADFGAGFGLHRYLSKYSLPNTSLQTIGATWSSLAPSEFNKTSTHGSSSQRVAAIEAGYSYAANKPGANAERALSDGVDYILDSI